MADIRLTSIGDIDIVNNDMVLTINAEAVAQGVSIRLRTFQGEYFLDTRIGMPYFQKILGFKTSVNVLKEIFRDAILKAPGVDSIQNLTVSYSGVDRTLSVSFYGITILGDTFDYSEGFIV